MENVRFCLVLLSALARKGLTSALLKFNLVEMLRGKKVTSVYDVASILHVFMLRATDQRRLRAQCAKSYIFPAVMVG